jgi:hypothetical protein
MLSAFSSTGGQDLQIRANQIKPQLSCRLRRKSKMKLEDMLECIRDLLRERKYIITTHAIFRMSDRGVTMEDLISLIADGEIIETYPDRKPCPAALVLGFVSDKPCHAVLAICKDRLSIITVYWPDEECWLDCRTRRL